MFCWTQSNGFCHRSETSAFNPAAIERLLKLGGEKFALDMIDLFFSYG